jgi:hypothetical protein
MLCHPAFKTFTMRGQPSLAVFAFLCLMTSPAVHADESVHLAQYGYPGQRNEYKEKFRNGPCEVEREQKRGGEYKQERKCEGGPIGYERKEKYRDGACKVEREWKRSGEYEEKVECEHS